MYYNWNWGNYELQYFLFQNLLLNSMIAAVGTPRVFGISHKMEISLALSVLYILDKKTTVLH
jgi:hypothetical protein